MEESVLYNVSLIRPKPGDLSGHVLEGQVAYFRCNQGGKQGQHWEMKPRTSNKQQWLNVMTSLWGKDRAKGEAIVSEGPSECAKQMGSNWQKQMKLETWNLEERDSHSINHASGRRSLAVETSSHHTVYFFFKSADLHHAMKRRTLFKINPSTGRSVV